MAARKSILLRGKIKGLYSLMRLDRITPKYSFEFLAHMAYLSKWIARHRDCPLSDFHTFQTDYSKRTVLYEHVIGTQELDDIDYFEFGVWRGKSFRWWVNRIRNARARFYGFDTFTGLPESWGPYRKGDFGSGDQIPKIQDDRHTFYQGLFQQTLIPFLRDYDGENRRKVIHVDVDLYSASIYVLMTLSPVLKPGDIVIFDEFNVPMHEFKAFREWCHACYIHYKVLGAVNNFMHTAIMILPGNTS